MKIADYNNYEIASRETDVVYETKEDKGLLILTRIGIRESNPLASSSDIQHLYPYFVTVGVFGSFGSSGKDWGQFAGYERTEFEKVYFTSNEGVELWLKSFLFKARLHQAICGPVPQALLDLLKEEEVERAKERIRNREYIMDHSSPADKEAWEHIGEHFDRCEKKAKISELRHKIIDKADQTELLDSMMQDAAAHANAVFELEESVGFHAQAIADNEEAIEQLQNSVGKHSLRLGRLHEITNDHDIQLKQVRYAIVGVGRAVEDLEEFKDMAHDLVETMKRVRKLEDSSGDTKINGFAETYITDMREMREKVEVAEHNIDIFTEKLSEMDIKINQEKEMSGILAESVANLKKRADTQAEHIQKHCDDLSTINEGFHNFQKRVDQIQDVLTNQISDFLDEKLSEQKKEIETLQKLYSRQNVTHSDYVNEVIEKQLVDKVSSVLENALNRIDALEKVNPSPAPTPITGWVQRKELEQSMTKPKKKAGRPKKKYTL